MNVQSVQKQPIQMKAVTAAQMTTYSLGRTGRKAPIGTFRDSSKNGRDRMEHINAIVLSFERKWVEYYFPWSDAQLL